MDKSRQESRSGRKKDDMGQRRRDVTSAMYFLVWHGGMGYSSADWLLSAYPKLVILFAKRGRFEARRCFPLFAQLLEKVANAA